MSFTPGFAPDAWSQWREFEPLVQEVALDLIEELAINPPPTGEYVRDTIFESDSMRRVVFLHVAVDATRGTVLFLSVGAAPGA